MAQALRAMILGSGFAGQGHATALRACGVEIAAMASRTEEVVHCIAAEMGIPVASTDWRATLAAVRPDIVAVGTPGGTHTEMVAAALAAGCHVLCDKPLATTAAEARALAEQAEAAGRKTAYAASYRYQPAALHARELVAAGAIGAVCEAECISHYNWPTLTSFGWPHRLATGGGRLNNNFTHKLAIVLQVLEGQGGTSGRAGERASGRQALFNSPARPLARSPARPTVLAAMGETRNDLKRVPVGPPIHDFREFNRRALTPEEAAAAEWREVDSDWSYTVLARIGPPGSDPAEAVSATFRHSALRAGRLEDYVAFYGTEGTIHIRGAYAQGALLRRGPGRTAEWEEIPIPAHITESLPAIADDTQRNWTQLCHEFVADIRGEGDAGYPTFRDGWLFQEVIDIVRSAGLGYSAWGTSDGVGRGWRGWVDVGFVVVVVVVVVGFGRFLRSVAVERTRPRLRRLRRRRRRTRHQPHPPSYLFSAPPRGGFRRGFGARRGTVLQEEANVPRGPSPRIHDAGSRSQSAGQANPGPLAGPRPLGSSVPPSFPYRAHHLWDAGVGDHSQSHDAFPPAALSVGGLGGPAWHRPFAWYSSGMVGR